MKHKRINSRGFGATLIAGAAFILLAQVIFAQSTPFDDIPEDLLNGFQHPPVIFNPGSEYGPDKRNYQGIPTIERAPNGRLWSAWYAGRVWEDKYNYLLVATSGDDGKTWSKVEDYLAQVTSRFHLRTLQSGNLLLVRHNGINERVRGRSHLTAYLSEDDGESWIGGLLLDEERSNVSYPDGTQAPDGTIYVTNDWERGRDKNILMTTFREEDVRRGEYSPAGRQRVLINFATGKNPRLHSNAKNTNGN